MLSYDDDNRGGWLAATTGDRLVLLPAADSAAGSRIWTSLTGAGSDEQGARAVLDELTAGGLSKTPPFALLTWDDAAPATVRVFVRGDVVVVLATVEGDVSIGGLGVSTWVERSVAHVRAVSVTAAPVKADPADADDHAALPLDAGLPLRSGMVRTRRLRLALDATRTAASAQDAAAPAGAAPTSAVLASAVPTSAVPTPAVSSPAVSAPAVSAPVVPVRVEPAARIVPPPSVLPVAGRTIAAPASEQTITDIAAAEPAAEEDAEHDADPAGGYDHLFGATVMRGVEQAAVRPDAEEDDADSPAPTTAAAPSSAGADQDDIDDVPGDHDGHTVMSGDIQKLRDSRRRAAAGPAPAAAPRLYLLLPSGAREPLNQPIRIGRAPSVSKMSGDLVPRLVSLGGADQDVSRNHVHFTVEGDTVVVTDLHSRNGTLVALPGKPAQKLRQGEPTAVIVGTVVDLGSGITITVGQE